MRDDWRAAFVADQSQGIGDAGASHLGIAAEIFDGNAHLGQQIADLKVHAPLGLAGRKDRQDVYALRADLGSRQDQKWALSWQCGSTLGFIRDQLVPGRRSQIHGSIFGITWIGPDGANAVVIGDRDQRQLFFLHAIDHLHSQRARIFQNPFLNGAHLLVILERVIVRRILRRLIGIEAIAVLAACVFRCRRMEVQIDLEEL